MQEMRQFLKASGVFIYKFMPKLQKLTKEEAKKVRERRNRSCRVAIVPILYNRRNFRRS
jgi:hypothetical protein